MSGFLFPTRIKLIIGLIVAISSFIGAEAAESAKQEIWRGVSTQLTKEYLMKPATEDDKSSFRSGWQRIEVVSDVERHDLEKALLTERLALVLIFSVLGYLSACLIVSIVKARGQM